jgi:hypothetical protein
LKKQKKLDQLDVLISLRLSVCAYLFLLLLRGLLHHIAVCLRVRESARVSIYSPTQFFFSFSMRFVPYQRIADDQLFRGFPTQNMGNRLNVNYNNLSEIPTTQCDVHISVK